MALFDSITGETSERFNLTTDQTKALLSSTLGLMTDSTTGGFSGFLNRFRSVNSGEAASSVTATGDNTPISKEQIESALGAETIAALADRAGLDYATTVSAMTFLVPQTVDRLMPDGEILDEKSLLAAVSDFSNDATDSTTEIGIERNAVSTGAFDRIGNATEDIGGKGHDLTSGDRINDFAAVGDRFSAAPTAAVSASGGDEFNDDSPLRWLLPLVLVALLVAAGFWFCGKSSTPHASINIDFDSPAAVSTG